MPKFEDKFRLICNLGKYQVVKVEKGLTGTHFVLQLPNNVKMQADLPLIADIQVGDILTLYTEVLADEFPRGK